MVEMLVVLGLIAAGALLVAGLLKVLLVMFLLPFKIAFLLAKGLFGLVIVGPVLIVTLLVIMGTLPIICIALLAPLAVLALVFAGVLSLLFG